MIIYSNISNVTSTIIVKINSVTTIYAVVMMCLVTSISCWCSNFWKPWHKNSFWYAGTSCKCPSKGHLSRLSGQGQRSKTRCSRLTKYIPGWSTFDWQATLLCLSTVLLTDWFKADTVTVGDVMALQVERQTNDRGVVGSTPARALLAQQP